MMIGQEPHHLILIQISVTCIAFIIFIINIKGTCITATCHICYNLPPVISFHFQKSESAAAPRSFPEMSVKSPVLLYCAVYMCYAQNIQT